MLTIVSATLDDLRQKLSTWKGIEIAQHANPVFGDGNPQAKVVFVGEAPGQKEDELGKPFVGRAGKILNDFLLSIGLHREDVYITNVVKFRPPENRDPTKEEKIACTPFLNMEIAIIKPKIVVTLGRHALAHFSTELTIAEAHGKPQKMNHDITIFPMYHPAAALYNPKLKETLSADFVSLSSYLNEQKSSS